eukprot:CAMPEP_0114369338 /NCGR_PEP_ID=MMETSP0101-20121206/31600_1 /TAXON_ID=38822 ORGANISM="Pteridomonas danica, Strain PT" /NCGR_SAMPLE_ID=MMETSP0101 /ASSEMBLY_ACC=CAM_ASM_000211 /LENGTH=630 /DNA_ID=CAMNT_0001520147 /DNA_START=146 /DNA_END=2038 /DNA_ORIENTATION=-
MSKKESTEVIKKARKYIKGSRPSWSKRIRNSIFSKNQYDDDDENEFIDDLVDSGHGHTIGFSKILKKHKKRDSISLAQGREGSGWNHTKNPTSDDIETWKLDSLNHQNNRIDIQNELNISLVELLNNLNSNANIHQSMNKDKDELLQDLICQIDTCTATLRCDPQNTDKDTNMTSLEMNVEIINSNKNKNNNNNNNSDNHEKKTHNNSGDGIHQSSNSGTSSHSKDAHGKRLSPPKSRRSPLKERKDRSVKDSSDRDRRSLETASVPRPPPSPISTSIKTRSIQYAENTDSSTTGGNTDSSSENMDFVDNMDTKSIPNRVSASEPRVDSYESSPRSSAPRSPSRSPTNGSSPKPRSVKTKLLTVPAPPPPPPKPPPPPPPLPAPTQPDVVEVEVVDKVVKMKPALKAKSVYCDSGKVDKKAAKLRNIKWKSTAEMREIDHYNIIPKEEHEAMWYTDEEWSEMENRNLKESYDEQMAVQYGYATVKNGYIEYIGEDESSDDDDDESSSSTDSDEVNGGEGGNRKTNSNVQRNKKNKKKTNNKKNGSSSLSLSFSDESSTKRKNDPSISTKKNGVIQFHGETVTTRKYSSENEEEETESDSGGAMTEEETVTDDVELPAPEELVTPSRSQLL